MIKIQQVSQPSIDSNEKSSLPLLLPLSIDVELELMIEACREGLVPRQ